MRFATLLSLATAALLVHVGVEARSITGSDFEKRLFGGGSNTAFPDPNDDPFYRVPSNVGSKKAGAVLASRAVNTTIDAKLFDKSYQVLYRTQNTQKKADATVATIWTPITPSSPAKVFSFQVFEDATQLDCNPSWAFVDGSKSKNTLTTTIDAPSYIKWALQQGFYVVAPDHLGSQSAFIAGFAQGYAVLDGVRAAINFNKLPADSPVGLAGYSGGASSTAWAANLAGKYASSLNIIGAVHGGTPVDTRGIYEFLLGGAFAGFAGAGLSGLSIAYPDLKAYIDSIVNDKGRKDLEKIVQRNECLTQIVMDGAFKNYSKETTLQSNPLDQPIPKRVLAIETLLSNVSSVGVNVPKFPTYQFHAEKDQVVPRDQHEQFIQQQCAAGAKIQYEVLKNLDHITATALSVSSGIKALEQIYAGTLDTSSCGQKPVANAILPNSAEGQKILGADDAKRINSLNGLVTPLGKIQW